MKLGFGAVVGEDISNVLWMLLRWPLGMALYFMMISYNYYMLPIRRVRFRDIVPGSIFAAVGFLVVTYAVSYTHLDVYKRQAQRSRDSLRPCQVLSKRVNSGSCGRIYGTHF